MIIVNKKKKEEFSFDNNKDTSVLFEDYDDPREYSPSYNRIKTEQWARLPEKILFGGNYEFSNYHITYDFNEQVYKKKKSYFHISSLPLLSIIARDSVTRGYPAVFYAMDVKTCLDYFKISARSRNKWVYIHHCANKMPMNLFNPSRESDLNSVPFTPRQQSHVSVLLNLAKEKNDRYWLAWEPVMDAIYGIQEYDGMALNYSNRFTASNDRAEGLCLFKRAEHKMAVMRIAKIPNPIFDKSIDPRQYDWKAPGVVVYEFENPGSN